MKLGRVLWYEDYMSFECELVTNLNVSSHSTVVVDHDWVVNSGTVGVIPSNQRFVPKRRIKMTEPLGVLI